MTNYNENNERYFLELDVQYSEKIHEPHNNLPFLPFFLGNENRKI